MTLPLLSRSLEAMTSAMEPQAFHRALAHWNHKRLAVGAPSADWIGEVREEHRMRLLEGGFIESFRAEVAEICADVPRDADGFIAWFEALRQDGPGQGDHLAPGEGPAREVGAQERLLPALDGDADPVPHVLHDAAAGGGGHGGSGQGHLGARLI